MYVSNTGMKVDFNTLDYILKITQFTKDSCPSITPFNLIKDFHAIKTTHR